MKRTLAFLACGICATAIALPVFADITSSGPVQTTKTDSVAFAPGGTIHLNGLTGDLVVDGWDEPKVEITVTKSLGYDSEPAQRATERLDAIHVATTRQSDTELTIAAAHPKRCSLLHPMAARHEVRAEYHIRVPRDSRLDIQHADGYVSVTGVTGDINAANHRGDIILMLPHLAGYSIDAYTKLGVVTSDVPGFLRGKRLTGETFRSRDNTQAHHLLLRMGFGGITLKDLSD